LKRPVNTYPPDDAAAGTRRGGRPTSSFPGVLRILLLGVALFGSFFSTSLQAADSPFTVDAWTTEDGLPQSSVLTIVQTHDGYLWLGTLNGLVRFDGHTFTSFNVNNTTNLPGDRIVFLFEDSRHTLWVGTDNAGLCAIRNGVIQKFDIDAIGANIFFASEDEAGGIWFGAANGRFFRWKDGQLDLNAATTQNLWARLLRQAYHVVQRGRSGGYWRLEGGHIQKWEGDKLEKDFGAFPWPSSLVAASFSVSLDANIAETCEDNEGNLVVGVKRSGVYRIDLQGGCRQILNLEDLSEKNVTSVCVDRDDNVWVGTDGGGLHRVKANYFVCPPEFANGVIQSVAEDAVGGLWVQDNTRTNGIIYFRTNSLRDYNKFGAWSVLVDQNQQVWAGTRGQGLFQLKAGEFKPVNAAARAGTRIYSLFQSRDGRLWVGSETGLASYDGQNWRFYTAAEGLPPTAVRAIAEDTNGSIWIGTGDQGLFSLQGGLVTSTYSPVKDISCLLVGKDNDLWVGSSSHGLARLADGHWSTFAGSDGLPGDDIGYLIEDDLGNLWIGSYEGLARVGESSLAAAAADKNNKISCRIFLTRECSAGAQPAAIRAHDGNLWFPTIQGLYSVNPADLKPDTNPPPVIIESVLVDGVSQKGNPLSDVWPDAVSLTPANEHLEIHFTALNFAAPKRAQFAVRFKYCLEGHDKDYTDIGGERAEHFNKLPAGNYFFKVIACNEDGVWNNVGAGLQIIVEPPIWQKQWFIAASTLLLLGILAGSTYLVSTARLKRELRALHQKEMIERERARIARDLHDQLGANLTQVALLGELAEADKDLPDEVEQHARQICGTARETTRALDEIVWAVNPSNDTVEGLANYACKYAQDYFALANVSFRSDLPPDLPATRILPEVRHNVFLAFKEAVNNVVKHAQATRARVWLRLEPDQFILGVEDNGRGLGDLTGKQLRNGLKNMRKRLSDVQGQFDIGPGSDGGTAVRLIVPLKK
jgi:ligand-binding sensor domain-containing protein/signal transduction histidine kinase